MNFSILMTAFDRAPLLANTLETIATQTRQPAEIIVVEDGYDDGKTFKVCAEALAFLPVTYICRRNRPNVGFSNPAIPKNIAIRAAQSPIILLQCAEVRYTKPTDLQNIIQPVEDDENIACFGPCEALDENGNHKIWYGDPELWNYNDFCMAMRLDRVIKIGGFDENFRGYGYEDNDFNWRLEGYLTRYRWAKNVITQHQFHVGHPSPGSIDPENEKWNQEYGSQQIYDYRDHKRGLESNAGKKWGDVNS